jgi:hypothetical protein
MHPLTRVAVEARVLHQDGPLPAAPRILQSVKAEGAAQSLRFFDPQVILRPFPQAEGATAHQC